MCANSRGKLVSPTNHCWCQNSRMIALSCGINIFAVHHLVLSQSTHMTDRQTDRQTDEQTELQQQYCALHYMQSHGKDHIKLQIMSVS